MAESSQRLPLTGSRFVVIVTGEIVSADVPGIRELYCKYSYSFGVDWRLIAGIEEGVSATAGPSSTSGHHIVLNTPLEVTFASTNPHGWPQVVIACYGPDALGHDVIRGYGATHIPTIPGRSSRKIPIFTPEASSWTHKLFGLITGRRAEFVDPHVVAGSEGRGVTRVSTQGFVDITFNVVLKDFRKFNYESSPRVAQQALDLPLSSGPQAGAQQPSTSKPSTSQGQVHRSSVQIINEETTPVPMIPEEVSETGSEETASPTPPLERYEPNGDDDDQQVISYPEKNQE